MKKAIDKRGEAIPQRGKNVSHPSGTVPVGPFFGRVFPIRERHGRQKGIFWNGVPPGRSPVAGGKGVGTVVFLWGFVRGQDRRTDLTRWGGRPRDVIHARPVGTFTLFVKKKKKSNGNPLGES